MAIKSLIGSSASQYTDELAQDAIGTIVDATLVYDDATPALKRAAVSGDITIAAGSNTAAITAAVIVNADINASAAIAATKIADGTVSSTEFQYINSLTSNAQTQLDGKQPIDSDLTTIAGLTATTDNFIQSKSSAWASRTIAQVKTDLARIIIRVFSTTSAATLVPEIDTYDLFTHTAQAEALAINNHSTSTPADGEKIQIRILDNGTARAITFGTNYIASSDLPLPTTTVVSKVLEIGFEWNSNKSKFVLLSLINNV